MRSYPIAGPTFFLAGCCVLLLAGLACKKGRNKEFVVSNLVGHTVCGVQLITNDGVESLGCMTAGERRIVHIRQFRESNLAVQYREGTTDVTAANLLYLGYSGAAMVELRGGHGKRAIAFPEGMGPDIEDR